MVAVDLKQTSQVTVTVVAEASLEQEPQVVIQAAVQVTKELEQVEQENLLEVLMLPLVAVAVEVSVEAEDHLGADRLDPQDLSVEAVIVIVSQVETILLVEVDQEVLRLEKIISNVMVFLENHKQCL